jgi:hypothetical protein
MLKEPEAQLQLAFDFWQAKHQVGSILLLHNCHPMNVIRAHEALEWVNRLGLRKRELKNGGVEIEIEKLLK